MNLIDFCKKIGRKNLRLMIILTAIAGLANSLLIVSVNHVAFQVANNQHPTLIGCAFFIVAFAIYYVCDRIAMMRANTAVERELKQLRLNTVSLLRQSELSAVERGDFRSIAGVLSKETNHLSITFPIIVDSFQQFVLLLASLAYLAYLSPMALVIFMSVVLIGAAAYFHISKEFQASIFKASQHQAKLIERMTDFLDGSKEMRQHTKKSEAVLDSYRDLSDQTEELMVDSGEHVATIMLLFCALQYSMLGLVAFVLPGFITKGNLIVFQLIPTILFCIGPVTKIVGQFPMFIRAEVGLAAIASINRQLAHGAGPSTTKAREAGWMLNGFRRIDYRAISYGYADAQNEQTFTSGPWDFHLTRGEIVFLVGGNGSGKSTALHLITGLYRADAGEIKVDGRLLDDFAFAGLREQFAAIFGNFHLFDRLYGLENVDEDLVNQLIADMELTGKVEYVNGQFTDLNLSTGQRKRLALIAALLEDRPVYAFDEWSAEQDVHFREVFYKKILPKLKQQGKTVVAVTHDERYWDVADRIVKFDLGQIQWERAGHSPDAPDR